MGIIRRREAQVFRHPGVPGGGRVGHREPAFQQIILQVEAEQDVQVVVTSSASTRMADGVTLQSARQKRSASVSANWLGKVSRSAGKKCC